MRFLRTPRRDRVAVVLTRVVAVASTLGIGAGAGCTRPDEDRAAPTPTGPAVGSAVAGHEAGGVAVPTTAGAGSTAPPTTGAASAPAATMAPGSADSAVAAPASAGGGAVGAGTAPVYPWRTPHSPLTAGMVARFRALAAAHPALREASFAKVGDSITASGDFLRCFAGPAVDLGQRTHLAPTLELLRQGDAGGTSPFLRESETAVVGWSAWQAVHGERPPLARELATVTPRWALVQYGTNDIQMQSAHGFAENLLRVIDLTLAGGTVPALFTIPPRVDRGPSDGETARHNAAIRGIAQLRGVPLVDYHHALLALPGVGMAWDGIHPNVKPLGGGRAPCDLGPDGLRYGYNLRNLLALEVLHRLVTVVSRATTPPDAEPGGWPGAGTPAAPWVATLPGVGGVGACARDKTAPAAPTPEEACRGRTTGSAHHFSLTLAAPQAVEVLGFDHDGAEVDLFRQEAGPDGGWRCAQRATRTLGARLPAGEHRFVAGSVGGAGSLILAVLPAP